MGLPQSRTEPPLDFESGRTSVAVAREAPARPGLVALPGLLRPSEWILVAYILYVGIFSAHPLGRALMLAGAASLSLLAWAESRTGSKIFSFIRDWIPSPFILVAYWAVDWYPYPARDFALENAWIHLDRRILNDWGAKAAIEFAGPVLPFLLEFCYSLLYAVPPVSIGLLYLYRRRDRVDRFVFVLMLGVLSTYALLPYSPSISPREFFPKEDLPAWITPFRLLNLWLLDHYDIHASVFPSGHVTVGYSAAFAMLLAFPEKRKVGWIMLAIANGVAVATVYGRYHYVVDTLAGLGVSLLTCIVSVWLHPALSRSASWWRKP